MDIGAFMQSLTGDSMAPTGNSGVGKTSMMHRWQASQDIAANDDNTSFLQSVRQILGKLEGGDDAPGESPEGSEKSKRDVSQAIFLLEMLGQFAIAESGPSGKITQDPLIEGSGSDLLALLNGQVAGLEISPAGAAGDIKGGETDLLALLKKQLPELEGLLAGAAGDTKPSETDLLASLKKQIAELETSMAKAATVINDETQNDSEKTLTLLRTAMGQIIGQDHQDQQQQTNAKNGSPQMRFGMVVKSQDQIQIADAPTDETPLKKQTSEVHKKSGSPNTVHDDGTIKLAQEKAASPDSKLSAAKTLVQTLLSQGDKVESQQESGQSPSESSAEKLRNLQGDGLKNQPLNGQATHIDQPQVAISPPKQDENLFSNDKRQPENIQHHLSIENEAANGITSDSSKTDGLLTDPMKVLVSADSSIDNRSLATSPTNNHPTLASSDTAFQKSVMDQIVEKATIRSSNDRSEMRIQLKPDNLGDVRMSIVSEKNQLVVNIIADKSETKEILENQIHHLKAELDKQGLTVGKIEVMISAGNDQQDSRGQFFQMFKNNSFGSGKRQSGGQHQDPTPHQQKSDDKDSTPSGDGINYFV
jgi:flagellar hook-length control protein FliK